MNPVLRLSALLLALTWGAAHAAPGDLDPTFQRTNSNPDGPVPVVPLTDGSLLLGIRPTNTTVERVVRVNDAGVLDSTFPAANVQYNSRSFSLAEQTDGRFLPGCGYSLRTTGPSVGFGRLNADGSADLSFDGPSTGNVFTMWPLDDGKTLIGGDFSNAGTPFYLARLNADGTRDGTFLPRVTGVNSAVYSMVLQPDGSIVFGGTFTSVGGVNRTGLARVSASGVLDRNFNPVLSEPFQNLTVQCLALQADGKILVGGRFTSLAGSPAQSFARLNPDGTRDTGFTGGVGAATFATNVYSMVVMTDGRILIAGDFELAGGLPRRSMAVFLPDGSPDPDIIFGQVGTVSGVMLQPDGKVLASGEVRPTQALTRQDVYRYQNRPATSSLTLTSPRRIQWLRGGSAPEAGFTYFEFSASATGPWTDLGKGSRLEGGWEISTATLPANGFIRARARTSGAFRNGSQALTASITPFILIPDLAVRDGVAPDSPLLVNGQADALDFGEVRQGSPLVRRITLTNPGNGDLAFTGAVLPVGYSLRNAPVFPTVVEPGVPLTLDLTLDALAAGSYAGEVRLLTNDPQDAVFVFPVSGTVVTPEIAVLEGTGPGAPELVSGQPAAVDFGRHIQGTPGTRLFTLTNSGRAPLLVSAVTLPPAYALSPGVVIPATIPPGAALLMEVGLTTLLPGLHAGPISILNDDLDENDFTFPITGEVYIPEPVATLPTLATTLNRQTGLREQTLRLTNDTTATVPGYRVLLQGLPPGVTVKNASETLADGTVILPIVQGLAPCSVFDLVIEYGSANRIPGEIQPVIRVEFDPGPVSPAPPAGPALAIERIVPLAEGSLLLEFASRPGIRYQIQYSADGALWKTSPVPVEAGGTRCQWIDRGPPRTESAPAHSGKRFYRVMEFPSGITSGD